MIEVGIFLLKTVLGILSLAFLLRFYRKRELSWLRTAHLVVLFSLLLSVYITGEIKIQKKR